MHLFALLPVRKTLPALAAAAALALLTTPSSAQDDIPNAGRLGFVSGNVSIEPAGIDSWGQAYPNLPLGPGDRIFTDSSGRAEIQVGQTYVRIGPNTDITLVNENPSSIAFGLAQGSVHAHILGLWPHQPMQIHTPNANITTIQPSDIRVDVADDQSSTVYTSFTQEVLVSSSAGFAQPIEGGQSLQVSGVNPVYPQWLEPAGPDDLDNWSAMRDRQIANAISFRYVSPFIPGAVELDAAGDWQPGTPYGAVWFPRNVPYGWAPYHYGHWVNHAPWGWMWVEDEQWGYAPFHYGRWVSMGGRWGWIPGPPAARPIFAPALVVFAGGVQVGGAGVSVWFPLGPGEPYRPWYPCPDHYVDEVNISNITATNVVHVQTTYVNIVRVTNVTNITYVNRTIGVSAMNQNDFASGRSASQAAVKIDPHQMEHVSVVVQPQVKPMPAAFVGRPPARPVPVKTERPVLMNAEGKLEAAKPGAKAVEAPVRPVSAPRPLPGRKAAAPPPNAKMPATAARPAPAAAKPAPPPARPAAAPLAKPAPAPAARQETRPAAPPKPENKPAVRPEARPETGQEPAGPETKPEARPAQPAAKPEEQAKPAAKPAPKPGDRNKKPEDKKPEDQKPQ